MRSLIVRAVTVPLILALAGPAFPQEQTPKNNLDPTNDPAIRKGLENIHNELSNILKQQTEVIKTVTPGPMLNCPPDGGNGSGTSDRLYGSGRTGLALVPVPADQRLAAKLDPDTGLLVRNVFPGTPAAQAGYLPGDILIEFNGNKVPADIGSFMGAAAYLKSDMPIQGTVLRDGKRVELSPMRITDRRVVPGSAVETVGLRSPANVMPTPVARTPIAQSAPIQRFDGVKDVTFANK